jgi:exosortase
MGCSPSCRPLILATLAAIGGVVWAYWPTLAEISEKWATDPQYTHGFLVPLFAGYLLWRRREHLAKGGFRPRWWGVAVVLAGVGLRFAGHVFYQPWLDACSLLVVLTGVTAAAGGRRALVWAAPALLFLAFIVPLPYRAQLMLGGTLQQIATRASTYVLQTVGVPAVAEGNVIVLTHDRLGVVEACNGLNMLVTFFALAAGVAILAQRTIGERLLIVASAVPIAVAANVVRISLTGVLFEAQQGDWAKMVFHDLAGWLMMPVALVMLLGELLVLKKSIVLPPNPAAA